MKDIKQSNRPLIVENDFIVTTYDIDIAGHLNNVVYVRWLEDLRRIFFDEHYPVKNLLGHNLYPVIASTNIKYKRQIKLFDTPKGFMWLEKIDRIILKLSAEFTVNGSVAAFAEQKCVIYNLETSQIVKPPEKIYHTFIQETNVKNVFM